MTSITDKRHTIKLETLGPIHIGSGNLLQNNIELVEDNKSNGVSDLYVIDAKKVLDIIGIDKIDTWVTAIDRGDNIKEFIALLGKGASPEKYSKRVITNYAKLAPASTLKECMHDGRGIAYIPGSSIKGAIRTAVLASIAYGKEEFADLIGSNKNTACKKVEMRIFGDNPNEDMFRFLQVGDAFFDEKCEISLNAININYRKNKNELKDTDKAQLVEAIKEREVSYFTIKLQSEYNKFAHNENKKIKKLEEGILSIEKLFGIINNNTQQLIKDEIEIWQEYNRDNTINKYIENLNKIQNIECKDNECILRVGHASGWRFMTGAWVEPLDIFFEKVIPMARHNNVNYKEYADFFPKTRRISKEHCGLFGFVKLTLQ